MSVPTSRNALFVLAKGNQPTMQLGLGRHLPFLDEVRLVLNNELGVAARGHRMHRRHLLSNGGMAGPAA